MPSRLSPDRPDERPPRAARSNAQVAFQRLTERAPTAIAVTEGEDHVLQSANPAFCRLMGVRADDLLGRPYGGVFPQASERESLALLDEVFRSGEAQAEREVPRWSDRDEEVVWSYTVWPVDGGGGGTAGLVVEVTDHTERSHSRRRLEEMSGEIRQINERLLHSALQEREWAEKAEAANLAKSNFLAVISHELRTPLNGIVGYTDVLEAEVDGAITEGQRNSLARIRACSSQLMELIDDVLHYARMEMEGETIQIERLDLCEMARQAGAVIEPVAARKGIELSISTPETPISVDTDTRKVRQILLNLLGNAVKFTHRGAIRLELEAVDGGVRFNVHDSGIGIPDPELERIFEPFVQAEPATTRRYGGTGLGLSISRTMARMLGGDVVVRSSHGEGSTFSVRLPDSPPPPRSRSEPPCRAGAQDG